MKTTAQHTHADGTVCWWDTGYKAWVTQDEEGLNDACPDPDGALYEVGSREELLVAGDAPHEVLR